MMASLNARKAVQLFSPSGAASVPLDNAPSTTQEQTPRSSIKKVTEDLELNTIGVGFSIRYAIY